VSAVREVELIRSTGLEVPLRISAKTDYAVRAAAELAAAGGQLVKAEQIAAAQGIPVKFLLNIMVELKHQGLVRSQRGADGGYRLARPAEEITLADLVRAVEGQLVTVRDGPPEEVAYAGSAGALAEVWRSIQELLGRLLSDVTLSDLVAGRVGTL
jgi:Rrf2 family protein